MKGAFFKIKWVGVLLVAFYIVPTTPFGLTAQEVNISRDINVRNDYAYDVFAIKDKIFFYRDKGSEYFFDVFDKELKYRRTQEVVPEDRKVFIENLHSVDSSLAIYYSFKEKDQWIIRAKKYSTELFPTDTMDIVISDKALEIGDIRTVLSEDKSHILLFAIRKEKIRSILIQTKDFKVVSDNSIELKDGQARESFVEVCLSDNGNFFYLFEHDNDEWDSENHAMRLVCSIQNSVFLKDIDFTNAVQSGAKMSYDNINQRLVIAGLWGEKSINEQQGYYVINKSLQELISDPVLEIQKIFFDDNLAFDLDGVEKKNKKNFLYDFYTKELVHRYDGGVILVTEMQRELIRRSGNLSSFDRAAFSRGYVDYYNEDMIVFSIDVKGDLTWRKVLFKKQFSQDDEGIYSSFFIMKVPSQIRVVFNDEIKNNSTVSEYILDPIGNFSRSSLLSTEYKNLKLRFSEAQQLSSHEFIVPSEKNGKVNLVKVLY